MAAVADSVENNDTLNLPENENLMPAGISATALPEENCGAFPELNQPDSLAAAETTAPDTNDFAAERWPGWPGDCVFRMIVPVTKVGAIIGRKGDFIKKMCEETRARIKVLDGPVNTPDRIVSIYLFLRDLLYAKLFEFGDFLFLFLGFLDHKVVRFLGCDH